MKRIKVIIVSLFLLLFLLWRQWPDNRLHLIFCDVGEGDAILVEYKTSQVLIDGGPDESVLACLARHIPFWDRKIELVISTHPEKDHFTGLVSVLERYQVEKFVANPFGLKNRPQFLSLINLLSEQKIYPFFPVQGDKIRLGSMQFDILWPSQSKKETLLRLAPLGEKKANGFFLLDEGLVSPNEFSLVVHLSFFQFDALLTGDAPSLVSQTLFWQGKLPLVEVLKAPHHGSKLDNPPELYQATRPQVVVISVGKNNFGHPSQELIERLRKKGIKVRRTDKEGEVEIVAAGQN